MSRDTDLSTRERVYQCIVQLCAYGRAAPRQKIANITRLKIQAVDHAIKALIMEARISRIGEGLFQAEYEFPPDKMMSVSITPSGKFKIEWGDDCWSLNPSEAGNLGQLLEGKARELAQRHHQMDTEVRIARVEMQARQAQQAHDKMVRKLAAIEARSEKRQMPLELER